MSKSQKKKSINATFENCYGGTRTETIIEGIIWDNRKYIIENEETVAEYLLNELRIHEYLSEARRQIIHEFPLKEDEITAIFVEHINKNYNYTLEEYQIVHEFPLKEGEITAIFC